MPVTITARRDGFRRCNAAHAATPTEYPDDHWTDEQLAQLKAEPNLVVVVTSATPDAKPETRKNDAKPGGGK